MADKQVTREDVAKLAGVSTAVVSYVVNGGPRPVAKQAKERVLAAIRETGYKVNQHARALAGGRTGVVGLVVPDITNAFFAEIAYEIQRESRRHGTTVLLGNSNNNQVDEAEIIEALLDRGLDAILLVGTSPRLDAEIVEGRRAQVILLDRVPEDSTIASVTVDNRSGASEATAHLLAHGRRHVAMIGGPEGLAVSLERQRGYRDALADAGRANEALVYAAEFTRQGGFEAFARLFSGPDRPDAVLVASEEQSLGAYAAAAELHLEIPREVAVFAFDGTRNARYHVPSLSTITQPVKEMARAAFSLLGSGSDSAVRDITCRYEFTPRASCGCVAGDPPADT